MNQGLTVQQTKFIKNLANSNLTQTEAAIKAGYSPQSADSYASQLLSKTKIIDALERAGISDRFISRKLKKNITNGSKLTVTPDVYMRSLDLVTKLKGYQQNDTPQSLSQTNVYINELKTLDDAALQSKLNALLEDVTALKERK